MALAREKSPDAFRTISEVADVLDTPAHVLRFWESKFSQIKPIKRGGGRRYYRPQDVNLLRGIRDLLYRDGLTIKGVQKILKENGVRHVAEIGSLDAAEPAAAPAPSAPKSLTLVKPEPQVVETDDTSGEEQLGLFTEMDAVDSQSSGDTHAALRTVYAELTALRDRMSAGR